MADYNTPTGRFGSAAPAARTDGVVDEGLRAFMLRVYNYMAVGLGLTGLTAYLVAELSVTDPGNAVAVYTTGTSDIFVTSIGNFLLGNGTRWLFLIAAIGFVFFIHSRLNQLKVGQAQGAFWAYAVLLGAAFSPIFLVYTSESIAQVFFITGAAFAGTSLFGYTTKADLSRYRSFIMMGVVGVIIAILVNWILQSEALMWAISVVGVLVFTALTAFETQRLKEIYYEGDSAVVAKAKAIEGALTLYVAFLYMFQFLLMLLGNRE